MSGNRRLKTNSSPPKTDDKLFSRRNWKFVQARYSSSFHRHFPLSISFSKILAMMTGSILLVSRWISEKTGIMLARRPQLCFCFFPDLNGTLRILLGKDGMGANRDFSLGGRRKFPSRDHCFGMSNLSVSGCHGQEKRDYKSRFSTIRQGLVRFAGGYSPGDRKMPERMDSRTCGNQDAAARMAS